MRSPDTCVFRDPYMGKRLGSLKMRLDVQMYLGAVLSIGCKSQLNCLRLSTIYDSLLYWST